MATKRSTDRVALRVLRREWPAQMDARLDEVDQLARGYLVLQARFREQVDEIKALRAAVKKRGGR